MLRAVSPLLIWFWSAFPRLLCNFVFKSSVAASLMCDTMHDEWLQCQSAWECVDACMSVAICAAGVELWCACAFELWCENARMSCLQLCAFGDVLSHLNTYDVALLVKYRSWLWRYGCDVGYRCWREIFGCENVLKFYSNSISVHILRLSNTPPLSVAKSYFLLLSWTLGACLHLLCVWTIFLSLPAMIVTKIMKSCLSQ